MQLDRTSIAIRQRGLLEIFDLALMVVARWTKPLLACWLAAALPLLAINYWLLGWTLADLDDSSSVFRYLSGMVLLVAVQAPVVSMFMTTYLGRAVFMAPTTAQEILRETWRTRRPLAWCLLVVRAIAPVSVLVYLARHTINVELAGLSLSLLAIYALALRATRPFMLEIILLERNPLRCKAEGQMSVRQRSRALQAPNTSELLGRWIGAMAISIALFGSIVATAWFISGMVLLQWTWGATMIHVVIPVALWLVAGFMAIVRFLSYLDLRIRCEGWEVELLLRAAAERIPERAA
jgi:hypothetical protein